MIDIQGMSRTCSFGGEDLTLFDDVTVALPTDRHCAILGAERTGKSVLMRILAGAEDPSRGSIVRYANISFPVGFVTAFRVQQTARQNLEHVARLYGADVREVVSFVDGVVGLGPHLRAPLRRLAIRERVLMAYALSYAIPFDTYLIDENIGAGGPEFREICHAMMAHRAKTSGILLATRNVRKALDYCDMAAVILDGKIRLFDDIKDGVAVYQENLAQRPPPKVNPYGWLNDEYSFEAS